MVALIGRGSAKVWTGLVMALALSLGASGCALSPEDERAQIEEQLIEHPTGGTTWRAVKRYFPDDFDVYVSSVMALPAADKLNEQAVMANETRWFTAFLDRTQPAAFSAPLPELLGLRDAQRAMAEAIEAQSVELCARFSNGEPLGMTPLGEQAEKASAAHNAAIIRASAAAIRDPQDYAIPTDREWDQLGDQMVAGGLPERVLLMMENEAAYVTATAAERCQGGTSFHRAMGELPDELSAKLFVAANMPSAAP